MRTMKNNPMVTVTIKLPALFVEEADRIANKNDWTRSQVLRKSIAKDFLRKLTVKA